MLLLFVYLMMTVGGVVNSDVDDLPNTCTSFYIARSSCTLDCTMTNICTCICSLCLHVFVLPIVMPLQDKEILLK